MVTVFSNRLTETSKVTVVLRVTVSGTYYNDFFILSVSAFLPTDMKTSSLNQGLRSMSKLYVKAIEALHRLRTNNKGVVSFEYIIVAACIVAVVIAVFKTDNSIKTALTTGIATISTAMSAL